jgi:hypothetical protein
MSAFLCSENHLSLLANAAAIDPAGKDAAFALLLAENLRSLQHRYPHYPDMWEDADKSARIEAPASELVEQALKVRLPRSPWKFDGALSAKVLATQIVKACDCYDYQACETDDYKQSEAAALVEKIRAQAIEIGGEKSGSQLWDAMLWELQ